MARVAAERARITRISTWITVAIVAYVGVAVGLSFRTRAPSAAQVLQRAFTAAGVSDAVHYRAVWSADRVSQIVVGDARPASGSETVSVGADQFTAVLMDHVLYFEGDAPALRDQLGLPQATASKRAGEWISILPSDGPYPSFGAGLTTSAALAQVLIAPLATSPVHDTHGALLTRIAGRIPHGQVVTGSARLDLMPRSGLPARYSAHGSDGGQPWSSTIVFSRWGEHDAVVAPEDSIPYSSLPGAGPG